MAVAIDGLTEKTWRLNDIVALIHEDTHRVNEVSNGYLENNNTKSMK